MSSNSASSASEKQVVCNATGARRLLSALEHCIPLRSTHYIGDFPTGENFVSPLDIQLPTSPKTSLCLAFDAKDVTSTGSGHIYVVLRKVDSPIDMSLEIEASVEWFKRPSHTDESFLDITDKSQLPCFPEPLIKKTLTEAGEICKLDWAYTGFIAVRLEVYAVDVPDVAAVPLLRGLEDLLASASLTDVVLKTDDVAIPAHQVVLAANSPVFRKMFVGDFKEAKEGVVDIAGTTKVALRIMLEYLYSAGIKDWEGSEIEVMELAERYMVDSLKAMCEARLLQMGPDTALGLLKQASKPIISSDVRMRAFKVVAQNWDSVFITPQWSDFQKECPVLADAIRVARALYCSMPPSD